MNLQGAVRPLIDAVPIQIVRLYRRLGCEQVLKIHQVKYVSVVVPIAAVVWWLRVRMGEREQAGCPATTLERIGDDRALNPTTQLSNISRPKHLILPLLVLVGVLLAVLSALLHRAVVDQNAQAMANSVHLAKAALSTTEQDLRVAVRDYSWWQQAIDELVIELNPEWAKDNVGAFVHKNNDVATTVVLGADNAVLYMVVDGERVDIDRFADYGSSLLELADKARSSPMDAPEPSSAYVTFRDEVHLSAAGALTPEHPTGPDLVPHSRPVLIFTRRIDEARLNRMAASYLLTNLRFAEAGHEQASALPLAGSNDLAVASLTWDVDTPGTTLLRKLTVPAAVVSVIVMGLMTLLCRRILRSSFALQRAAIQLQDQNARLVRSEAIAVRALSEVATANQHKSQFLTQMSHELRTPLNAIIGFADVMILGLFGPLSQRYQEYAEHIHSSGKHLLALVNQLLDLSRIEAGTLELAEEDVEVGPAIFDSAKLVEQTAATNGVAIVLEVAPVLPRIVADARAMRQVLINLIGNAVKFTPRGGEVRVSACLEQAHGLVIRIADTGVGMTASELECALTLFGRADTAFVRSREGTGLGLPIARHLIEAQGAVFTITSQPGHGTIIEIHFPAERVAFSSARSGNLLE